MTIRSRGALGITTNSSRRGFWTGVHTDEPSKSGARQFKICFHTYPLSSLSILFSAEAFQLTVQLHEMHILQRNSDIQCPTPKPTPNFDPRPVDDTVTCPKWILFFLDSPFRFSILSCAAFAKRNTPWLGIHKCFLNLLDVLVSHKNQLLLTHDPGHQGSVVYKSPRALQWWVKQLCMFVEATSASERRTSTKSTSRPTATSPATDNRKRRRNRATQSCINCHATKKSCDRKRPCTRCTQLGLTGICIYKIDNHAAQQAVRSDESSRLINRVAELEGVIRELQNKPHPRWTDVWAKDLVCSPPETSASPSGPDTNAALSAQETPWASDLINLDSSRFSQPSNCSHCCLCEPACYNMALQLASELRRATESADSYHFFGQPCMLSTKISELEAMTRNSLQNSGKCTDELRVTNDSAQTWAVGNSIWDASGLTPYDDPHTS